MSTVDSIVSIVIFHICLSLFQSTLLNFCKPQSRLDLPMLCQGSRESMYIYSLSYTYLHGSKCNFNCDSSTSLILSTLFSLNPFVLTTIYMHILSLPKVFDHPQFCHFYRGLHHSHIPFLLLLLLLCHYFVSLNQPVFMVLQW